MPACADNLSRAACLVQKSKIQLRADKLRTDRVLASGEIGPRCYLRDTDNTRVLSYVGRSNATHKGRQKFMNLRDPRSGFPRQALYGVIAIVCLASLPWSSPLVLAQEARQAQSQEMTTAEEAPKIPNDQLDSLVAPISHYPDDLLAPTLA